jgi:hypothetical protein
MANGFVEFYEKKKVGWDWGKEENVGKVSCKSADVLSRESAYLHIEELLCQENASINVDHSATLKIDRLVCKTGKLNVSYSSKLDIAEIKCDGTLDIQDAYSSTILLNSKGLSGPPTNIGATTGVVRYSSLAVKGANCTIGQDTVTTEYASTWQK